MQLTDHFVYHTTFSSLYFTTISKTSTVAGAWDLKLARAVKTLSVILTHVFGCWVPNCFKTEFWKSFQIRAQMKKRHCIMTMHEVQHPCKRSVPSVRYWSPNWSIFRGWKVWGYIFHTLYSNLKTLCTYTISNLTLKINLVLEIVRVLYKEEVHQKQHLWSTKYGTTGKLNQQIPEQKTISPFHGTASYLGLASAAAWILASSRLQPATTSAPLSLWRSCFFLFEEAAVL